MKVEFYFDPICPWCWVTSRWLLMASNTRQIEISWRLFSLAYKNSELKGEKSYMDHVPSHRVERVMVKAENGGAKLGDLYSAFGIRHFLTGVEYTDEVISSVIDQLKLPSTLVKAADDKSLDKEIIASSKEALKAVGQDIGVPTIVFDIDGKKKGFFGPVIKELPDQEAAAKLWDGLVELVKNDGFYELKRGRIGKPDVYSTAKR